MSDQIKKSVTALRRHQKFTKLIRRHGPPELKRGGNVFQALTRSIIYQQLSGKAAATIFKRFLGLFPKGKFATPEQVRKMSFTKLRSVGLSGQKATYVLDLAKKFADGSIKHRALSKMTNEEVVEHLTQVKGIGEWTAHMFLIFTLNRPDVFPTGDLGVRKGFQKLYGLRSLPSPETMEKLAKPWREHATVASWYLWKIVDTEESDW